MKLPRQLCFFFHKVIKKKLVRKALDMIKKMDEEQFDKFWKEYSTNIKLGVIEDSSNRNRLAKLLRSDFTVNSSSQELIHYCFHRSWRCMPLLKVFIVYD